MLGSDEAGAEGFASHVVADHILSVGDQRDRYRIVIAPPEIPELEYLSFKIAHEFPMM